jgi:hypothetical protein
VEKVNPFCGVVALTIAEAVEYDQLAETLIKRLEQIGDRPGYIDLDTRAAFHEK